MVDVVSKLCAQDGCTKRPNFNFEGSKTALYCKQHAEDGMVDVRNRRCLHGSCRSRPTFNAEGSKTAIYCKTHAEDDMVNVLSKRCSHNSCPRMPTWGLPITGTATVCARHKDDILGSPVINFKVPCKMAGCKRLSKWGLAGKQPSHCPHHGSREPGLECTVSGESSRGRRLPPSLSHGALGVSSFHVKAECLF